MTNPITANTKKVAGTKQSELIIGTAANKLQTASRGLLEAFKQVEKIEEACGAATIKLTDLEAKYANLEIEYTNKVNQQKLEIKLAYDSDQATFANNYLSGKNMVAVKQEDYVALQNKFSDLQANFEKNVAAEIAKVKGILENQYISAAKLKEAEFTAKEAQNTADITSLKSQLSAANAQSELWRTALDEERKAGVQRAQAGAIGSVNVTSPGR